MSLLSVNIGCDFHYLYGGPQGFIFVYMVCVCDGGVYVNFHFSLYGMEKGHEISFLLI